MKSFTVYPLPEVVETKGLVVLVDILRASSTITAALGEEALVVKPVATVEEALLYRKRGFLVAGERGGLPPEGFDLGNSPREAYRMARQKVVLTTTNGTKALGFVKQAGAVCAGSFLNLSAVVHFAERFEEVVALCAGTEGALSLEDFLFAGYLGKELPGHPSQNDAAVVARHYARGVVDLREEILEGKHAQRLRNLGLEEDVLFCAEIDRYDVLPLLTPEGFTALKGVG